MKKLVFPFLLLILLASCTEEQVSPMFEAQAPQGRFYKLYDIDHHEISTYTNVVKSNQRVSHDGVHADCPQLLLSAFIVSPLDESTNLIEIHTSSEVCGDELVLMTSPDASDTSWVELTRWKCDLDTEQGTVRVYEHKFK